MKCYLILALLVIGKMTAKAQMKMLNIPALHQLVAQSETEYNRQVTARNRQAVATANEQANLTLLEKLKAVYRKLQQRYNVLGSALQAAQAGYSAGPMVQRIISNQSQIISLASRDPALVVIGYQAAIDFSAKAESISRYLAGLVISYGDINQMRSSDRKILFDYALLELSNVQDLSGNMLSMMQNASAVSALRSLNPFQDYVDIDKDLINDILTNAKYLKP
ncbi:hypothetical protein [Mucilaginibacter sp. SJ]|uniref:hypothetical protein n=1 Tax=Mucilaginibacter sp. SJ TaxID=3029053 RepID=UPI0023A92577|nr:hypothetical protein [Mucilaginibacter sp. SJ]WEA01727.1 hypothetical protein MusilaSJ_02175 [Mucilaginibacter sp. SJ]